MQGGVRSDEPGLEKKELEGKEDGNPFSLLKVYLCVCVLYFKGKKGRRRCNEFKN